jgi:hypothetical protein
VFSEHNKKIHNLKIFQLGLAMAPSAMARLNSLIAAGGN